MEMVKVGGHLLLFLPCNNFAGHGFYQFSPELFFRALSEANGFALERLVMFEMYDQSQWYEVADPATVRSRVEHVADGQRVSLWVRARRTADVPIFQKTPQQSDYNDQWWKRPRDGQPTSAASTTTPPSPAPQPKPSKFLIPPDPRRQALKRFLEALTPSWMDRRRSRDRWRRNRKFAFASQPRIYKPVSE
jgi:hypothetical protein